MKAPVLLSLVIFLMGVPAVAGVQAPDARKLNSEIEHWIGFAKKIAAATVLIDAVAAQNECIAPEYADMEQIKWAALADLDPLVTALSRSAAGQVLKAGKSSGVSEIFVSDRLGRKVALLAKTTNWCHGGKEKHEKPMKGEVWIGQAEHDESTGKMQVQLAVPVLKDGKAIGSLVLGVEIAAAGVK